MWEGQTLLFAVSISANITPGIGTLAPASGPASGGASFTLRGSGFHAGTTVTIGGKPATVAFKDMNTLMVTTPSIASGPRG